MATTYYLNDYELPVVAEVKDLGILFDSRSNFHSPVMWKLSVNNRNNCALTMSFLGLANLSKRRCFISICFMYKLLNRLTDATDIANSVAFYDPQYPTRLDSIFHDFM